MTNEMEQQYRSRHIEMLFDLVKEQVKKAVTTLQYAANDLERGIDRLTLETDDRGTDASQLLSWSTSEAMQRMSSASIELLYAQQKMGEVLKLQTELAEKETP